jgi:hypothetical protein
VALPPWARGSARLFVETCAAALESPIATAGLPRWIDLVFGHAQPFHAEASLVADNIFYPMTYRDHVMQLLESESEEMMRAAYLEQAYEFGQCPTQAFRQPHPCAMAAARGAVGALQTTNSDPATAADDAAVDDPAAPLGDAADEPLSRELPILTTEAEADLSDAAGQGHGGVSELTTAWLAVSGAFPSWNNRSILSEIYLCHARSCHEIEDGNTPRAGRRALRC